MNEAAPRLAFGIGPDGTYTRLGQTAAFILGVLTMLVFFPFMVAAALLYARAEERFGDDPGRARTLVQWSWLGITAAPALAVAIVAIVFAVMS